MSTNSIPEELKSVERFVSQYGEVFRPSAYFRKGTLTVMWRDASCMERRCGSIILYCALHKPLAGKLIGASVQCTRVPKKGITAWNVFQGVYIPSLCITLVLWWHTRHLVVEFDDK